MTRGRGGTSNLGNHIHSVSRIILQEFLVGLIVGPLLGDRVLRGAE